MTALTQGRTVKRREGLKIALVVKAGETIHQGAIVMLDGSEAINGKTVASKKTLGIALTTSKGGETLEVETGIFAFENSSSSAITIAEIGTDVYVEDDQTVAKTNSSGSVAGKVIDVNADGVWVKLGDA